MNTMPLNNVVQTLLALYPQSFSPLDYRNEFEFLICVILSAQTQDKRVNQVSPYLFQDYPSPATLKKAPLEKLEEILHPLGFYRQKAKNIKKTAQMIDEHYQGRVPYEWDALLSLKGVGRKTANVIRGHFYKKEAIIVDTHFKRVTSRLKLSQHKNPEAIEKDLKNKIAPSQQFFFSMAINQFGREQCTAFHPHCDSLPCPFQSICSYYSRYKKKYTQ